MLNCNVKSKSSNFRLITVIIFGVQILRFFTVNFKCMLKLHVNEDKDISRNMTCVMALKLPLNALNLILKRRLNFIALWLSFIRNICHKHYSHKSKVCDYRLMCKLYLTSLTALGDRHIIFPKDETYYQTYFFMPFVTNMLPKLLSYNRFYATYSPKVKTNLK